MKTLILTLLLIGFSAYAEEGATSPTEATTPLNCEHSVPGTSCPVKYSSPCQTLLCDTQVKATSPVNDSEGSK